MISANHAATSASDAGDRGDGGTSPELLGTALRPAAGRAEGTKGWPLLSRIQRTKWEVVGSPELMPATSFGGDGVRWCSGASLRCISEQMERLGSTC